MSQLAEFVRNRREDLGLTLAELGAACGLTGQYIGQAESGINPQTGKPFSPKVETLRKLAKGLRVPYETLDRLARGLPATLDEEVDIAADEALFKAIEAQPISEANRAALKRMVKGFLRELDEEGQ